MIYYEQYFCLYDQTRREKIVGFFEDVGLKTSGLKGRSGSRMGGAQSTASYDGTLAEHRLTSGWRAWKEEPVTWEYHYKDWWDAYDKYNNDKIEAAFLQYQADESSANCEVAESGRRPSGAAS